MKTTVKIKGMTCQHCAMAVKKSLQEVAGVTDIQIDMGKGEAVLEHSQPIDNTMVKTKIEKAGYDVV